MSGNGIIPRAERVKLAQIIGCDVQNLAPCYNSEVEATKRFLDGTMMPLNTKWGQHKDMTDTTTQSISFPESDGCFVFGSLKTSWMVLDGDGTEAYLPQHIRSHYIPVAQELPEEFRSRKNHIQREQEEHRAQGLPSLWNGEIYSLDRFVIGRDPIHEEMILDLWFRPSDYYTFQATNMSLKDPEIREKYLQDVDWFDPLPLFSHSFGICLAVVSSDGYTLFTERSKNVGSFPSIYETSVVEGLSRPLDRGISGEAPDIYRCACRGLSEELGLREHIDFSASDITFLSFGVNTRYALRGLTGIVKSKRRINELVTIWNNGARDKFENRKLFPVPFTPPDIVTFAATHQPFSPGPTLYHALVHEFGRADIDVALSSLF
jgi:hypothetical protein